MVEDKNDNTVVPNAFRRRFPFSEIRPVQGEILDLLDKIYSMEKYRYIVIEAGTGIGKSAIAKAIAGVENRTHVLTATKQLQDQYEAFDDGTVAIIKGQSNYKCAVDTEVRCSSGPCKFGDKGLRYKCYGAGKCPYNSARAKAEAAPTSVTSYAYFLSQTMREATVAKLTRDAIIIDECHLLEDQLISFAGFSLSAERLDKRFDIVEGADLTLEEIALFHRTIREPGYDANIAWIDVVKALLQRRSENMKDTMTRLNGDRYTMTADELQELNKIDKRKLGYKIDDIDNLIEKIDLFRTSKHRKTWLINVVDDGLKVEPLDIEKLFNAYIGRFARKHVIFMSATILNQPEFCRDIGLTPENTAIIVKQSTFDPYRSPIVDMCVGSMSYRNLASTMPEIIRAIEEILARHKGQKGIIHTSTYNIANHIVQSINSKRFISSLDGLSNEEMLRYHQATSSGTVLVSPSMMTGVDLEGDLARFQIIVKMPFASMKDPRIKTKMEINKTWYLTKMMRNFVQACGRGTRSDGDWSVTYVLDSYFPNFIFDNRKYLGRQFSSRVVTESQFNYKEFLKRVK